MLRAAALPGAGVVLPWLCVAGRHSVGRMVHALGSLGLRASADLEETWRSFVSLEEPGARQAFLHTVRGLVDLGGQRVSAADRLYLTADLPTLILWGARDPLIPVRHAHEAHERIVGSRLEILPGAGHFLHRDEPARFVSALLDFVETTLPMPIDSRRLSRRLRVGPQPSTPR
jgi:pimeloyl-ACP methyl ester carboxylesterase